MGSIKWIKPEILTDADAEIMNSGKADWNNTSQTFLESSCESRGEGLTFSD
jgi:hypothetical protein